jgi:hypothetical protein
MDDWSGLLAAASVCAYKISYAIRVPSELSATPAVSSCCLCIRFILFFSLVFSFSGGLSTLS